MKIHGHEVSLANNLTVLGMLAAIGASYADSKVDSATQKERVDNLKQQTHEIKTDVKETKESVQLILRKLDAMEASRAAEAKAARERSRSRP